MGIWIRFKSYIPNRNEVKPKRVSIRDRSSSQTLIMSERFELVEERPVVGIIMENVPCTDTLCPGKRTLSSAENGQERAILSRGDFFLIPPELVHRDVNPNREEALVLIFSIGKGPTSYEVSGPSSTT